MPRKEIPIPFRLEHLSILNENGEVDRALEPDLPQDFLIRLFRAMLLARKFDERLLNLQRQGRIGTFAPISGQEASQIGAVSTLRETDWFAPSFRETGAELWRGRGMETIIMSFGGIAVPKEEGPAGEPASNLPISIPVGTHIPHAAGLAWAVRYRKRQDVVMAFFGDGATSEGDFHEGLNFAGVFQVPAIFVCQNNHWAISVPRDKQTRSQTLAQKAIGYGIFGIQVDGNDILASYVAAKEAVDRARAGGGPTLIECVTYRMTMHTTADDPKRYRKEEEVNQWRVRDPLTRFQKYLLGKGLDKAFFDSLEEEVAKEIQEAVNRAEEKMKRLQEEPLRMFDHLYAEMPESLRRQREEFIRLQKTGREGIDG